MLDRNVWPSPENDASDGTAHGGLGADRVVSPDELARGMVRASAGPVPAGAVLGFFVIALDAVVVSVALPSMRRDLEAGMTGLQRVVDGYTRIFAALLLSAGALVDRAGARRAFVAVGTQVSMLQAIRATRPGGHVGYVGVSHGVELPGEELSFAAVHVHGGPAPVRRFLPELIDLIWTRQIDPGKVFDPALPLDQAAEGYRAMDERRAIKALLP